MYVAAGRRPGLLPSRHRKPEVVARHAVVCLPRYGHRVFPLPVLTPGSVLECSSFLALFLAWPSFNSLLVSTCMVFPSYLVSVWPSFLTWFLDGLPLILTLYLYGLFSHLVSRSSFVSWYFYGLFSLSWFMYGMPGSRGFCMVLLSHVVFVWPCSLTWFLHGLPSHLVSAWPSFVT